MEGTSVIAEAVSEAAPAAISKIACRKFSKRFVSKFVFGLPHVANSFYSNVWKNHKTAVVTTIAVVVIFKARQYIKKRRQREEWNWAGENVVVLHGAGRATSCPSLSPFILKLETYLRMSGIDYKYDVSKPFGPKGKTPWITLNAKDYSDSQLIMEFLSEKFNQNFSSHLNDEQKAVARALLIMTDEHVLWGLVWWRLVKDPDVRIMGLMKLPFYFIILIKMAKKKLKKALWIQGLGRHSDDEVVEIIRKDLEAISSYLGTKEFLMGDTPCEVDCAVFGMISQFVWGAPGSPFTSMIETDFRNLLHHCIRMQKRFWPDWDELLLK